MQKIKEIFREIFGRNRDIEDRTFSSVIIVGGVISSLAAIETCLVAMDLMSIIALVLLMIAFIGASVIALYYKKIKAMHTSIGLILNLFVLPIIFLFGGGISGGGVVWLSLGVVYPFLLFDSKKLQMVLSLTIAMDVILYVVSYRYQDVIKDINTTTNVYIDSLFSVIVVGLAVGIVFKLQIKMYNEEREVALKQRNEIDDLGKARSRFFTSMSHELRTPINSIILLDEMILREESIDGAKEYAENLKNVSKMLLSLINDILDFSQMENGSMKIIEDQYDTQEVLKNLIEMIKTRSDGKGLKFVVNIDPFMPRVLYGDKKRIQQVLINLLTNAVKYTNEGSVTFSVNAEYMPDGENVKLTMSVADTGIGIKKENIKTLYDYYSRVSDKNVVNIEGNGLGLYISKQLTDLMNGEIRVDSVYTKGSVFTVIINQKVVDNSPIGQFTIKSSKSNQYISEPMFVAPELKVLVVDDNQLNADLTAKILENNCGNVDKAYSGESCLAMAMNKAYHVIILDNQMQDSLGTEIIEKLRNQKNGLCKNAKIILASAESQVVLEKMCNEYGFDEYIEKPIMYENLGRVLYRMTPKELIEKDNAEKYGHSIVSSLVKEKKQKVRITTDSIADLPERYAKEFDIRIMHSYIKTKHGRFADTFELSSDNLSQNISFARNEAEVDFATVAEYEEFFSEALETAEEVVHIGMSNNSGKTFGIAENAAKSFENVTVIDSTQISCGEGLLAVYAGTLAKQHKSGREIVKIINELKNRVVSNFMAPDVKLFYENGYCKVFTKSIISIIKGRPLINLSKGRVRVQSVIVGSENKAIKKFIKKSLKKTDNIDDKMVYITYIALSEDKVKKIVSEIQKNFTFKAIIVQKGSYTSGCKTGNGTFGFAYLTKE